MNAGVPQTFEGVPVEFSPFHPHVADARGFWWNKRIVVGPTFMKLDPRTQASVLMHEVRHCKGYHVEQRVASLVLLGLPVVLLPLPIIIALLAFGAMWFLVSKLGEGHELDADAFAAEQGYGVELLTWIRKQGPLEMPFYPDFETRCKRLEAKIKERDDATAQS